MTLTMMILFEISNNQPPLFHIPEIHLCLFSKRQKINYGVLVLISQIRSSKKKKGLISRNVIVVYYVCAFFEYAGRTNLLVSSFP